MNYKEKLKIGNNNGERCSCCGRTIPKEVGRITFDYSTRWGTSYKRLCGLCIQRLYKALDKKPIKVWEKRVIKGEVVEEL